ncbi:cytochrome D ABC superfamily ATP binding cassette transporter, ATP-binding and permease protein [Bifidobacterium actinocoloniiforme DSM 22766]|uniref:Cytochrome D ABC superfamily ATP binding cassette transporter, ATP-binding and permease protein n=2 Tax=Bifidobacterium actinocoloniiforme TaxID=638619 RepID=A0A086Z1V2_9BIFI|nr:cytochrome D ABC superfamily ATP binding cassette transporter, ATP-binding and permease protein [Bifidobacterium actinocoloniiforme DSM 22766]
MLALALLSILQGAAISGQAAGLTWALVRIWHRRPMSALLLPALAFLVAFTVRQLIEVAKQRMATSYADGAVRQLRPQVQEKVFRLGPAALTQRGTGSAVTMLIDGLDEVKTYIQTVLPKMMDMTFIPLITLVLIWSQSPLSGIILLCMLPLLFFFLAILGLAARDRSNKQYAQFRKLNTRFVDTILGLPTLKMLGISEEYESEIESTSDRFRKRTMSVIRVALTSTFALDFFTTLAIAMMAVFLGNRLIDGTADLFPSLLALILAPDYFLPIRQFGDDYHATLDGKNALTDMQDLLSQPEPKQDDRLDWDGWGEDSQLTVRGLNFTYPTKPQADAVVPAGKAASSSKNPAASKEGEQEASEPIEPALTDLGFTLKGYSKVAVIGRSGAGKSTLVQLLAGFNAPSSGSIELDGRSMGHFNAPSWQRHIAYIPQDPYIFSGSIADNIRFYAQEADDSAIAQAATQAGLDDWLGVLPEGLGTQIGEGHRGISGGQAQRISLARVLLDSTREILLFDEPTAHLDIETEYDLKQTLLPIMEGHLVIFATHRLHWLADADQVIMLDQGRIAAQGAPKDLIGQGGPLDQLIERMGGNQIAGYLD